MFFLRALTLCLAVGAAFGSEPVSTFQVTMETTLAELMLSSPFFRGAEPFNLDCVDYYVPELKVHADKYDADVLVCTNNYNTAYEKIDGSYTLTRTALFDNLRGACNALTACDDSTTNAGAFQCLAKTCPNEVKVIEQVADDATDKNKAVLAEIAEIQTVMVNCQTVASRTYKANHGACLEDLNSCMADPAWEFPSTGSF